MSAKIEKQRQFTGRHMLGLMVAFFGVIISVNLIMAYFANSTWSGLVVKNSYVASQHFNEQQAEARAHAALGWKPSVTYSAGIVGFTLLDAKGAPVEATGVKVKLMRPAHEGLDQTLQLTTQSGGVHTAPVDLVEGQWVAEVLADAGLETPYRHATRFIVKAGDR